ncbi:NUDIX hydrolase [Paucilactobacillus hokkaidonensis JCM 18461]|uniref:Bis(5'-nucleosyl)-tetraphosphatase [asymmetrical] n=2 Tax=Paucilactobacillus hokkaidonensis TaxID=1193095 RepID=A0A0A1GVZ2_9LACO|nr:NUDIX domain-containing protein [Paucilactobacillus hokkaidonensis]KRO11195.1 Bis(5-nucleosyl)-tetraphosphatase (asymmetrical) [Paucilactobacillus hokkaidonensis]BAP86442.1 NUDIX hydrolase [Paucilactobacillus hokkaidonensis JCM 18461]
MLEITSGAVVYQKTAEGIKYLLLQSTNKGQFWGFPKGHVESGETLLETAEREILEETQLSLTVNPKFSVYTEYDLPNGNRKQMTLYTTKVSSDQSIKLQAEEIKNAVWLGYSAAREKLTYDNLKQLLDQINEELQN